MALASAAAAAMAVAVAITELQIVYNITQFPVA